MSVEKTRPPHGGHGERGITVLLRRMHDAVAIEATPQERLDELTRVIASHVVADVCSIYLRRGDDELELYSTEGLKREAIHRTRMKWGEGLVGAVADSQSPLVTADAALHPAFKYFPDIGEDPLHSFLGVPLIRSGKVLGVLVIQNKARREYTDEEIEAVQAVAILLAEITASGELLDKEETQVVDEMLHRPERLEGAGVAPGIAIGVAVFREAQAPKHRVFSRDAGGEATRLEEALVTLRKSVDDMLADDELGGESREIIETYRLFAYDRGWKEKLRTAVFSGLTAEAAVERVQSENRARLSQARDPYLRERLHDLEDLSNRLLRCLSGEALDAPRDIPDGAIVIARVMGPAELLEYDRAKLQGIVLVDASATSHVAIVARALDIPVVTAVPDALDLTDDMDPLIIDGGEGVLHIRPTAEVTQSYREKRDLRSERHAAFAKEARLPTVTQDGVEIDVYMNAGLALDMPHLEATGAKGVGLFRTELPFLIGRQLPRVKEQERLYRDILEKADGKPVIFRTADLGSDKSAAYMKRRIEANPAMGWRGMRMAVDRPGYLRPQLRALLAASARRHLYIMFPMVTLGEEIDAALTFVQQEVEFARQHQKELPANISVGVMIETPAAAWRVEEIAPKVDFLSVGGNDLAQFYFAADRESELTQRRYDPMEAGFLSFLKLLAEKAETAGKPLSYCGEQASNPVMAAALIAVGVRRFSIAATAVGPFRRMVRSIHAGELAEWMSDALAQPGSVRQAFETVLRARGAVIG
ncbi:MAG: phosphoenolpyruvate--protein phosphotransferase [Pseudomonadota bacterium]